LPEDEEDRAIPPDVDDDDDDDDDEIDDITDVWDEERLKAALGELRKDTVTGPATESKRDERASIEVDEDSSQPPQSGPGSKVDTDPPPGPGGGLSWAVTIGLALVLAVAVYLLVTLLK